MQEIELERPTILPLDDDAQAGLARFTEAAWQEVQAARATTLAASGPVRPAAS